LLKNAGVSTALVDYLDHIFLLFDSGLSIEKIHKLPLEDHRYLQWKNRVWVPLEITRIGQSFAEAWDIGLKEMAKIPAEEWSQKLVITTEAWQVFPPIRLEKMEGIEAPSQQANSPRLYCRL
jgi:hypothetical protein